MTATASPKPPKTPTCDRYPRIEGQNLSGGKGIKGDSEGKDHKWESKGHGSRGDRNGKGYEGDRKGMGTEGKYPKGQGIKGAKVADQVEETVEIARCDYSSQTGRERRGGQ